MNYYTPLRYPGGKGKLAGYIKAIIAENDLGGCRYAEVYAGGAGVAIELLMEKYVSTVEINDLNLHIHSFWRCVFDKTDELCKLIRDTEVSIEEWHRQKAVYERGEKASLLKRGFATFFLNRTNRSGILKAGVIGGKAQEGKWKLDARYTKADLIGRIEEISLLKDKVTISRTDGLAFVESRLPSAGLFMYLDPPYYVKGEGLYDNFYSHDDHARIAAALKKRRRSHWVVSYDDVAEIRAIYAGLNNVGYNLSYSAAERYKGAEVMFFSSSLQPPRLEDYGYKAAA